MMLCLGRLVILGLVSRVLCDPVCSQTTNEPGILVLIVVSSFCCFIAVLGNVLVVVWAAPTARKLRQLLHIVLAALDILSGVIGVCFIFSLCYLDTCSTGTLSVRYNTTSHQPLLLSSTHLFLLLYKTTPAVLAFLAVVSVKRNSDQHKSVVLWLLVLVLGVLGTQHLYLNSFNIDSHKLIPSLLYLPTTTEQFLIEHFSGVLQYVELYKPVLPVLVILVACLVVVVVFKPGGVRPRSGDLLLMACTVLRLLCIPVLLLIMEVDKSGLMDDTITSVLLSYGLVVLPLLLNASIYPIIAVLERSGLCGKLAPDPPLEELGNIAQQSQPIQPLGENENSRNHKPNKSKSRQSSEKKKMKEEGDIDLGIDLGVENFQELLQDTLDKKLPSFFGRKTGVQRDEKKVDDMVKTSQSKANAKRNEVVNLLAKKQRERQEAVKDAKKSLKKEGKIVVVKEGNKEDRPKKLDLGVDDKSKRKKEKPKEVKPEKAKDETEKVKKAEKPEKVKTEKPEKVKQEKAEKPEKVKADKAEKVKREKSGKAEKVKPEKGEKIGKDKTDRVKPEKEKKLDKENPDVDDEIKEKSKDNAKEAAKPGADKKKKQKKPKVDPELANTEPGDAPIYAEINKD